MSKSIKIGIIGGSGFYQMPELENPQEKQVPKPKWITFFSYENLKKTAEGPHSDIGSLESSTSCPNIRLFASNFVSDGPNGNENSVPVNFRRRIQSQFGRIMHHRMISRQQNELSLGLTLVAISILFIVCQSVKLVPDLYELFCPYEVTSQSISGYTTCHSTKLIDTFISLANLFACINSSANFLIYMLRGKKFRDAFLSTYWSRKQSHPGGQMNSFALKRLERGGTFTNGTSHPQM